MPKKIQHNGQDWITVPAAARFLETTAAKVREVMGSGEIEWTQIKEGRKLFVSLQSVLDYDKRKRSK
jgi:hypothetical protein